MHKKQGSLVPLTFEYALSSEEAEAGGAAAPPHWAPPASGVLSRKGSARTKSPEPVPCECTTTALSPRPTSPSSSGAAAVAAAKGPDGGAAAGGGGSSAVLMEVDGHAASVSLTAHGLEWTFDSRCCLPGARRETVPFAEVLSAELLPPRLSKWLWRPASTRARRLAVYTFRRAPSNPASWHPRRVTLAAPADALLAQWASAINAAAAAQPRRPRRLLVLINPFGGRRRAGALYDRVVAPVLERAGVKATAVATRFAGDARDTLLAMSADELSSYDGVVAVGGDGLFHEIVNGLLGLRQGADARRAAAAGALRAGHVPAGSTDAVACSLHGTRSAFTAACHVALGDGVPLDVLRIDAADGAREYAACMASYGFMGDVMAESERLRWLGPLRYDLVGARMLAANRAYRCRLSYLPAQPARADSFSAVCAAGCLLCARPGVASTRAHGGGDAGDGDASGGAPGQPPAAPAAAAAAGFGRHSRHSLGRRPGEWVSVEDDFAGIMLVVMPCRSDKSAAGVARFGHLSDGALHLVLVRRCSRWAYLRFLLHLSRAGLEAGRHHGGVLEVVPALAVRVEPGGAAESQWNVDGELLGCGAITAEVHRGAIEVFARGVETEAG